MCLTDYLEEEREKNKNALYQLNEHIPNPFQEGKKTAQDSQQSCTSVVDHDDHLGL